MTFVWVFDFATFLATLMALIILWSGWRRVALQRGTKWVLIGLLSLLMFHSFSNVLEWSSISKALDPYEDYIQIMEPLFWGFFFYAFLQEIADKDLREREEKYRMLFNSGNDAVFVHELTEERMPGKFIEVNDVACKRLGYTREELLELSVADVDAPEKLDEVPAIMEKFLSEGHSIFEQVHVTKEGRRIPVEISSLLFDIEGRPTVLSIARDITERKKAEKELKQKLEELEKMNRLMVGRELKMIELKEQIKELEEKISGLKERAK